MKKEFLEDEPKSIISATPKRCQKYYLLAKKFGPQQMQNNKSTEGLYHQIIKQVKKLYADLPNETDRTVFEMNRKADATSVTGMHDFLTPSFYWNLECDVWGKYWIYYAFNNCPFERQITDLIDKWCLMSYSKVKELENFSLYYRTVMACQPKEFIFILSKHDL